jgi:GNAT superfamily N-acetyltransferase
LAALRYETLTGDALSAAVPALAELRIAVFRDWPYLYEGDPAYEARYLARFAAATDAVMIAALDGDRLVGASTGLPLAAEHAEFTAPFAAAGYDVERVFYLGESVLLPNHRGMGAGHRFFDGREAHARALGRFSLAAFCRVVRDAGDPRRPSGYRDLDPFWTKRGYAPMPGLVAHFSWMEIGSSEETPQAMHFWTRPL